MGDRREEFAWYADWAADVSPLYERLARGALDAPHLLEVASEATRGQPGPQLLLGAVHARLLDGVDHRLAAFYPTCTADPLDPATTDPFPAFREFVLDREDEVRSIVGSRRVQTNEVGRTAVLLPAFEHVSRVAGGGGADVTSGGGETNAADGEDRARNADRDPLALVEVGASAGLNLRWDSYRYEYAGARETEDASGEGGDASGEGGDASGERPSDGDGNASGDDPVVCGLRDAPVTVASAVRGDRNPPLPKESLPRVASRAGVDLNPLDVTDPDDAHWLRALVVPDQLERHDRLATAVAAAHDDPPDLVAGDALAVLADLLDEQPEDATRCVFSTLVLYQLSDDEVAALRDLLAEASRDRPVHWLSADPAEGLDDLTYRHVAFDGGDAVAETRLAGHESYGAWVRWLADGG